MKKLNLRTMLFAGFVALNVLLVIMFIFVLVTGDKVTGREYKTPLDITGFYTCDGGEAHKINSVSEIETKNVSDVIIEGKLSDHVPDGNFLVMYISEAWVEIEAEGKVVASNHTQQGKRTNTPGISILFIPGEDIPDNGELTFRYNNPYSIDSSLTPIEDSLSSMCFGERDIPYIQLLEECTVSVVVSLGICFLGLFAFTLAGLLWKKIIFRNLSLAFLAVAGGVFALTDTVRDFLPLWIKNPVACLVIDEFTMFLLPIAAFLYIRQFAETKHTRNLLFVACAGSLVLGMVAYLFQIFGVVDILLSQFYLMLFVYVCIIGVIVLLIYEGFFLKCKSAAKLLATLMPLILASIFDALNIWLAFAPGKSTLRLGLLFTIASQLYFLIVETIRHNKEAAEYEKLQHEMLQMRIAIMASQIQPHFLYNSLTSIAQLCEKDPPLAKKATIEFADYMRHNMNSLKDEKPVPFSKELSHLETYVWLEKMRFGEDLNVIFDIKTTDFLIPSLAVQPLVENAVKHGVGMKEDGGTVIISTEEFPDFFEVKVSDDGVGFDSSVPKNDGRTHVGMENVSNRLKTMCNAEVDINSVVGEGTTVTIKIPKEDE